MGFDKKAPDWKAEGIEPPLSKREIGWEVEDKPPAAWLNWYMNTASESIQELQTKAAEKAYVDEQISEAIEGIEVDVPDASLTQKGVAMLEDSIVSTSITKAATPNSVKVVNDSLVAHRADDVKHVKSNAKHVPHLGTTTNVGNAYSVATTEVIAANQKFTVRINVSSTGPATLNVSSIGIARTIFKPGGAAASPKNGVYTIFYSGSDFQLLGEGGEYGTAGANQTLAGYTAGTENGIVQGLAKGVRGDTSAFPALFGAFATDSTTPYGCWIDDLYWVVRIVPVPVPSPILLYLYKYNKSGTLVSSAPFGGITILDYKYGSLCVVTPDNVYTFGARMQNGAMFVKYDLNGTMLSYSGNSASTITALDMRYDGTRDVILGFGLSGDTVYIGIFQLSNLAVLVFSPIQGWVNNANSSISGWFISSDFCFVPYARKNNDSGLLWFTKSTSNTWGYGTAVMGNNSNYYNAQGLISSFIKRF